MQSSPPREVNQSLQRLEALTDGVLAIVLTLLVFNISLPKDRPISDLQQTLLEMWPSFVAYAISFAVVGVYWAAHHNMFRFLKRSSHELAWINLFFLGCVSLVPFSASVLAQHHDNCVAVTLYGGNLTLIGFSLFFLWRHATYQKRLMDPNIPDAIIWYGLSRIIFALLGYGTAVAFSLVQPAVSLVLFAVVPLAYIVPFSHHWWMRRFGLTER